MKRPATPEQIATAKERRAKTRGLAKQIAAMAPADQAALVHDWPTTIEGHRVSLKNAMLIALQGGATVIGGLAQWRKAGRKVMKCGHSVQIFVPLGLRKLNQEPDAPPDAESPQGFGIANVFDISQTIDANAEIQEDAEETGLPTYTETTPTTRISEPTPFIGETLEMVLV